MTAARHASPPAARPVLAAAITLAVLVALAAQARQGANMPAVPWHYPCLEHAARWGRLAVEWFTPARDFVKGLCLR